MSIIGRSEMYDKYVTMYSDRIAKRECNLADGLFYAEYIMGQYKSEIWDFLEKIGVAHPPDDDKHARLESIEWDFYDRSIELMDCEDGFTLTTEQDKAIRDLGFSIIFVNYKNGPHLYDNHTASMEAMPVIKDV
jgi:hypothetical protein